MPLNPSRTVDELRELRELTGDENGAQRVAWTDTWKRAQEWMSSKLEGTGAVESFDAAGNQWWTLPGASRAGADPRRPPRLRPERGLARRLPERGRRLRGAAPDRGGGRAAADRSARLLGRRGGRSLRPLALRLVGRCRLDGRSGRAAGAEGRRRRVAARRDRGFRRRSRLRPRRPLRARERGRLPRAAHRAGAGPRVDGPAARRRARHLRRRAPPDHVARPGGACRLDADGPAPRRARRRRQAGARAAGDRSARGRRRGADERRRRLQAGDRHVGRRDGRAAARHAPPRRATSSPS